MSSIIKRIGDWFARRPVVKQVRLYSGAKNGRFSAGFGSSGNSSADGELNTSLTALRSRSRQLVRDNAYAKRAKLIVVNNVVGSGIGLQAQVRTSRDTMAERINEQIEEAWRAWCAADSCHTGGVLHFSDMERLAMGQVFEAGEVIIRLHFRAFGDSRVPLGLEVVEAERIAAEHEAGALAPGARIRMGIEVDLFNRPIAYWIRKGHPGDLRDMPDADKFERVPADQILHLKEGDRWPQTRGVPWLHPVLRKLDDIGEYSGSEVQAARASSLYFGTIESPESNNPMMTTEASGTVNATMEIEAGLIQQLLPGEKLSFHTPSRPNTNIEPFIRYMLREVAAGVGPSYESLSRDYSQSNYSSSRLALLDDRDLWRVLQQWWCRSFRDQLHKAWLRQAVLARAIPAISVEEYALRPAKFEAVLWKCRGWSWVDPTKEVNAYKEAVKAGFTTVTDVIAATAGGADIEDVIATRKRELQMFEDADIDVDTTVEEVEEPPPQAAAPAPEPPEDEDEEEPPARLFSFGGRNG